MTALIEQQNINQLQSSIEFQMLQGAARITAMIAEGKSSEDIVKYMSLCSYNVMDAAMTHAEKKFKALSDKSNE